jgi:D-hexose-6-phosphate mutarotase
MQELYEIVEDLQMIATVGSDTDYMDSIMEKWEQRLSDAEDEAERQYEMEFAGVTRLLDKRWEKV